MIPSTPFPPTTAGSIGPANLNETTPAEQRSPDGHNIPKTDGPRRHPETNAFLPAEYERTRVIQGVDGKLLKFKSIRRDR
jgi:hypothetical protein